MAEFPHEPHNWLIHKLMWESLSQLIPRYARGALLDVGCGQRPYRTLALAHIDSYVGIDAPAPEFATPLADLHADAQRLPVAAGSVDTVLCSELLEHLPRPYDAIREFQRVLRPGGHVILTTPLFWQIHEAPRDYFRFTKYGLASLFESSGFEVVHSEELTGFLATAVQMTSYAVLADSWWLRALRPFTRALSWAAQRIAYRLNARARTRDFSCLTIVVARKPATAA